MSEQLRIKATKSEVDHFKWYKNQFSESAMDRFIHVLSKRYSNLHGRFIDKIKCMFI